MGKVHGSLARAGKVKGQTPKIDKIEKKKQPRGRCVWYRTISSCKASKPSAISISFVPHDGLAKGII